MLSTNNLTKFYSELTDIQALTCPFSHNKSQ